MRIRRRHLLIASVAVVVLAVLAVFAWRYGWSPAIVPPADNAYVGLTREQIIGRLGTPDNRWPGHYGLPEIHWAQQHEPCETFTYEKWNGTLYLSVSQKNGQWVCFRSQWLPKGGAF